MQIVKIIHIFCAYATGLGFLLRGILAIWQNPVVEHRVVKMLPHIIDTCLLVSGLFMVLNWVLLPTAQLWLLAKLLAVFLYVLFGLIMLRWGVTARRRWLGLMGGLLVYGYIIGTAHSKSAQSFLSFL